MQYSELLKLTANSAWEEWYNASAIACELTATAWTFYTDAFFSERAMTNYGLIGEIMGHCICIAIILCDRLQTRIDTHIKESQTSTSVGYPVAVADGCTNGRRTSPADRRPRKHHNRHGAVLSRLVGGGSGGKIAEIAGVRA